MLDLRQADEARTLEVMETLAFFRLVFEVVKDANICKAFGCN